MKIVRKLICKIFGHKMGKPEMMSGLNDYHKRTWRITCMRCGKVWNSINKINPKN